MNTFTFHLGQKCTVWYRTPFEIEAETEEAIIESQRMMDESELEGLPWEEIEGTVEMMLPCKNDNQSVTELYLENGSMGDELLYHDGQDI